MRRIGVLLSTSASDPVTERIVAEFEHGLQQMGWNKGQNILFEYRFGGGDVDRMPGYAAELLAPAPDVVLASTAAALLPLRQATETIPIVFINVYDPVATGFVPNLNRPDRNITGFTLGEFSLGGKMLDVLKKLAPNIDHASVLYSPDQPPHVAMLHSVEAVAPTLGVRTTALPLRKTEEIDVVVEKAAREPNGGLVVLSSVLTFTHRERLTARALQSAIPAIYGFREYVTTGGLVSYGTDVTKGYRLATAYIDRILKGTKLADLPVQQPTNYEMAINLTTARALGLTVPPNLLAMADTVIE